MPGLLGCFGFVRVPARFAGRFPGFVAFDFASIFIHNGRKSEFVSRKIPLLIAISDADANTAY
jgi:hypothetical protein